MQNLHKIILIKWNSYKDNGFHLILDKILL